MTEHSLEQRRAFVDKVPCLSQDAFRSIRGNRATKADDYLALQFAGEKIYPAFQFDGEGKVKPGIKAAFTALGERRTPWKIAFWFVGNGTSDGIRPVDMLDNVEWITQAARAEGGYFRNRPPLGFQPTL